MFTGLVTAIGTIAARSAKAEGQTLVIAVELPEAQRAIGASISVAGVCLTVTHADARSFSADAAFETLRVTTLGRKAVGDRVNLEPALRVGDPLGGHLVSGHVDGIGRVRSVQARGDARHVIVDAPRELLRFCAPKGSICVDGTSLTINEVDAEGFAVGLVPHTLAATTLGSLEPGDELNLEVDVVARYVARLLATDARPGLRREDLVGFLPEDPP